MFAAYLALALVAPASAALSDVILSQGPSAYWKLDETSGTSVQDSSGNGRNGNLHASGSLTPRWGQPGLVGPALDLQGPNAPANYIVTNYDLATLVGSVGSVSGLIQMPDSLGERKTGCAQPSHMGPSVFSSYAYYQGLTIGDDCGISGLHAWSFYTGSSYTAARVAAPAGEWVHFAWVQWTNQLCLYVNGHGTCTAGSTGDNLGALWLGAQNTNGAAGVGYFYPGKIQHVATFPKALSPAEIQEQYDASSASHPPSSPPPRTPPSTPPSMPPPPPPRPPPSTPPSMPPPPPPRTPPSTPPSMPPTPPILLEHYLALKAATFDGERSAAEETFAQLKLNGRLSTIELGDGVLSATCPGTGFGVQYVSSNASHVHIRFINVPPTCINVPVNLPCAADEPEEMPPLFWCVFIGETGIGFDGPRHAYAKQEPASGKFLTKLTCSLPDPTKLREITANLGTPQLNVSVVHGSVDDFLQELPFAGLRGGSVVRLPL